MSQTEARQPVPSDVELGRRAFRRVQTVKSVLIAAASSLVLGTALIAFLLLSPGWARIQAQFLSWDAAMAALPKVWEGFLLNLQVLGISAILILVVALLVAAARTLPGPIFFPVRVLAAAYTDLFRGIPLIILLMLLGFGIPGLGLYEDYIPIWYFGILALTLTYSAYVAEVFRSGIEAVHPSQRYAARSLGLSHGKTMRLIVIPQAVRKVTPALMNDFVALQKDVGLISVLGAVDAVRAAQISTAANFNYTPYVVAAVLFILLAIPTIRLTDWYAAKLRAREQTGAIV